jgi:predicted phosphodiesterase
MACLRAAVTEINGWNPDLVLVKGDIAHTNVAEEYDLAFGALGRLTAPLLATAGNHDGGDYQGADFAVEAARLGHSAQLVHIRDLGSWRIVVADTVVAGKRSGTLEWDGPCLVALHHQLMRRRVPHYVPTGIPSLEAEPFLRQLTAVNPRVLVTSGHTHRHRVRRHGSLLVTEVGSTKDYPGTWAGYELYEGGVIQTVRRIADAEALTWNERTRQAALGIWGWWAPGTLADRCFSHSW